MDTNSILANEARRQELRQRISTFRGKADATSGAVQILSSQNADALRSLEAAQKELIALEAGAGPGITDEFGERSAIDNCLRKERFAGKKASVEFIKTHETCTEEEAIAAWVEEACKALGVSEVVQSPKVLGAIYRDQLLKAGRIVEATWEAQRAWVLATPLEEVMGL